MATVRRIKKIIEEEGLEMASGIVGVKGFSGSDIFDKINNALEHVGNDGTVFVDPNEYTNANSDAVSTQLQTTAEGQTVMCWGADFNQADGADLDSMVNVQHDSFSMNDAVLRVKESNNPNTTACVTADNVTDLSLNNIEPSESPIGIDLTGCSDSSIVDVDSNIPDDDLGIAIRMQESENISLSRANITGFRTSGIQLIDSSDITVGGVVVTTDPNGQPVADQGILVRGSVECTISASVESFADVQEGLTVEPFDPGGTDQVIPNANDYDMKIEGARDIAVHMSDADAEIGDFNIVGDTNGGRTTQAFLIDAPNGVEDTPGHQLDFTVSKVERVTDTQISSTNSGVSITGHIQKVNNTSDLQNNGTGLVNVTFGPATPNPVFNILSATTVETDLQAKRDSTDGSGQVPIDWGQRYAFVDKPMLNVLLEQAGDWHVASWVTDGSGRYTGANIQVNNPDGTAVGSGVSVIAILQGT